MSQNHTKEQDQQQGQNQKHQQHSDLGSRSQTQDFSQQEGRESQSSQKDPQNWSAQQESAAKATTLDPNLASASTQAPEQNLSLLEKAEQEAARWKTDYLYLRAEFDNFRKHSVKERSDLTKYGAERFLRDFLDIMDNMERALITNPTVDNMSSYVQGVQMIAKEIQTLLVKHGVSREDCYNQPFDPVKHEALGTEPSQDIPSGHVSRVIKSPYKLHDKMLRTAQVLVAK
jgi:molecular chaperone GrpE